MGAFEELIAAIQAGNADDVRRLTEANPGLLNQRTEDGLTPLMVARYHGQNDLVKWILDRDVRLDLYEAAATGRSLRVLEIIKEAPDLVNSFSPDGFTPLSLAAFFSYQTVTEILLARGADPNLPAKNPTHLQPLHSAAASRHLAIAEQLLKAGANPNARQQGGFTPLHAAAQNGQVEMARLLLRYGADPSLATEDGHTALDFARESASPGVIGLLS